MLPNSATAAGIPATEGTGMATASMDLAGRTAVVTGAGWGIGRAIAHALAESGAHVIVAEIDRLAGEATAEAIRSAGGSATFARCDVTDREQIAQVMAKAAAQNGVVDILVNNAGIPGMAAPADQFDDDVWEQVIAVDLSGVFRCTKAAIPYLEKSGNGSIINIASTFGMVGAPETPAYAAAKGGVVNLTRQLAVDLGPRGIRVNAVSPGYVANDMARRGAQMPPEQAAARWETRERLAALQPLGRQGSTDEIAAVVRFLASDQASFMTGAIVPVDGGCTATFNRGGERQEGNAK
jgi:NAD(P)-dependent dehydrogenase (short-subunit alcohol dehydrogenase family)